MKRIPIITSLILFIVLCITGSYWVMQLIKPDVRKVSLPEEPKPVADVDSVASLFGGAMIVDTNYQLKGLIQANPMDQSEAIIEVDGSPMKSYSVNSGVGPGGSTLSEVYSDYVLLKGNGVNKRVELPKNTSSSTQITPAIRSPIEMNRPADAPVQNGPLNRGRRGAER